MTPYETYKTYISLKKHFTSDNYDFIKYNGKTRASIKAFNDRKDRYFFELLSRQKKNEEIIEFFVSNFVNSEDPARTWIGEIITLGPKVYLNWKSKMQSFNYLFEQDLKKIAEHHNILDYIKLNGTKHPQIFKDYLSGSIQLETMIILLYALGLIEKYDNTLQDPIWKQASQKIKKYKSFLNFDFPYYESIIRKIFL